MTTAPAPTTVFSPMVTPGSTIAPPPSQTLSPMVIGATSRATRPKFAKHRAPMRMWLP